MKLYCTFCQVPKGVAAIAWMVILGDGIHNFTDGLAIGAAFTNSITGGVSTSVAVFCHELPHEIGQYSRIFTDGLAIGAASLTVLLVESVHLSRCFVMSCLMRYYVCCSLMTYWSKVRTIRPMSLSGDLNLPFRVNLPYCLRQEYL